jgi:serine/threonine protein kinase
MVTAAEALDQLHSRGISHGDIREANVIVISGSQERFPMRFVDFGAANVISRDEMAGEAANGVFHVDTILLLRLLVEYFGISREAARPLLRAIPRRGAIMKFIEVWQIHPTYEEQLQSAIAGLMRRRGCSEEIARECVIDHVT